MHISSREKEIFITDVQWEIVENGHDFRGSHEDACRMPHRSICTKCECAFETGRKKFSLPVCSGRSSRTAITLTATMKMRAVRRVRRPVQNINAHSKQEKSTFITDVRWEIVENDHDFHAAPSGQHDHDRHDCAHYMYRSATKTCTKCERIFHKCK